MNGMLSRSDKKKIPIALMPNGTGNDLCGSFCLDTIDQALGYFLKGDVVKMDVIKVHIDHENESTIPPESIHNHMRYSIINSSISVPAKISHTAASYKRIAGGSAYTVAALREFLRLSGDVFDIEVDGKMIVEDLHTVFLMANNGKFGGGRMMLNPYGVINDG